MSGRGGICPGEGDFCHIPTYHIYIYILLLFGILASFALFVLIVFMYPSIFKTHYLVFYLQLAVIKYTYDISWIYVKTGIVSLFSAKTVFLVAQFLIA